MFPTYFCHIGAANSDLAIISIQHEVKNSMNPTTNTALVGILLAVMAMPAYSAEKIAVEKSGAKAEHGEKRHGQIYGGHGRRLGAMMGRHGKRGGRDILTTFDTDGDGRVTQAEIDAYRSNRLMKFDADGDGSLKLSEYEALWLAATRERMVDRFQDLDADGNGAVTTEEFKRPFANLVRHMDKNRDGVLSREHEKRGEQKQE